jgi:hypothetical protein
VGGVSGVDAGAAGGTDWGPLDRAIAGEVAVVSSPAFDRLPRPFNARMGLWLTVAAAMGGLGGLFLTWAR